ncbi:hypothetical protein PU00_03270 [Hafnia alvei]|nr:hypothetical protein PU00_03270 [Hafnia alvei]
MTAHYTANIGSAMVCFWHEAERLKHCEVCYERKTEVKNAYLQRRVLNREERIKWLKFEALIGWLVPFVYQNTQYCNLVKIYKWYSV